MTIFIEKNHEVIAYKRLNKKTLNQSLTWSSLANAIKFIEVWELDCTVVTGTTCKPFQKELHLNGKKSQEQIHSSKSMTGPTRWTFRQLGTYSVTHEKFQHFCQLIAAHDVQLYFEENANFVGLTGEAENVWLSMALIKVDMVKLLSQDTSALSSSQHRNHAGMAHFGLALAVATHKGVNHWITWSTLQVVPVTTVQSSSQTSMDLMVLAKLDHASDWFGVWVIPVYQLLPPQWSGELNFK
ncbi:hypothetical protein BDQ17DRAFT_1327088 [Cyathus striatus]|nr:hypothetical protein BDQ17DRAFT_1327088 [Cyathus striatus]